MAEKQGGGPKWEVANAIQVKFRCPEDLKSRIDNAARDREVTISYEISRRLDESFGSDKKSAFEAAFYGGQSSASLIRAISGVLLAAANRGDFKDDVHLRYALRLTLSIFIRKAIEFDDKADWNFRSDGFDKGMGDAIFGDLWKVAEAFLERKETSHDAPQDEDVKYA